MKRSRLMLVVGVLAISALASVGAWAHVNVQDGGPNGDTLDGHAHIDRQFGRGGCDNLLGRDAGDEGWGGDSGCDQVRGMEGAADAVIVCDDGAGNDVAYGGSGPSDICYGSSLDVLDLSSCEYPSLQGTNCS